MLHHAILMEEESLTDWVPDLEAADDTSDTEETTEADPTEGWDVETPQAVDEQTLRDEGLID